VFGFQTVERKEYKKNFLRKVFFQIEYDSCKNLKENSSKIEFLFKDDFPRFNLGKGKGFQISIDKEKTNFQHIDEGDNIILKSLDGQKEINIGEGSLNFSVEGNVYSRYNSVLSDLEKIIEFLRICDIKKVKRFSIRKINIVEFKNNDNPNGILDLLLNKALINNNDAFPNMNNINHNIHSVNFVNENYFLNLKYGMNILPQLNSERGQLIIDIEIVNKNEILLLEILKESGKINSEIFNVFDWVINENTKNLLNNG
jgi:uncharacterized protein (TIGR04255 family)